MLQANDAAAAAAAAVALQSSSALHTVHRARQRMLQASETTSAAQHTTVGLMCVPINPCIQSQLVS
jgi:hypothetical protein